MASTLMGLNQRGSRWYININIVILPDLREVYGKCVTNVATGTSYRKEATVRGTMSVPSGSLNSRPGAGN